MEKKITLTLIIISTISILLTGQIISESINTETQRLIIQFEYAGRFEVIYTHNQVSESVTKLGIHQIYVSRRINEPWEIYFTVSKIDSVKAPLFIYIRTMEGEEIYRMVLSKQEGYLNMDCNTVCEITNTL